MQAEVLPYRVRFEHDKLKWHERLRIWWQGVWWAIAEAPPRTRSREWQWTNVADGRET